LTALEKAISLLEVVLQKDGTDDVIRDATIQRFEYTYELAWKILKRYLKNEALVDETAPIKTLYREAVRKGLIDKVESWFAYHDARNLTTHIYDEHRSSRLINCPNLFTSNWQQGY